MDLSVQVGGGGETTKTLTIDVILTNQLQLLIHSGIYGWGLSDHPLVYGLMHERVAKCSSRVIKICSTKNFEEEKFKEHFN